ncbi:MAG: dienelactone hydrolase family protein [Patescibacteria group bacterium]
MKSEWAIVVLPEIFGVNGFVTDVVERLRRVHSVPVVALDFMHAVTGTHAVYPYADMDGAHAIAQKVTDEMFLESLKAKIDKVQAEHPEVKKIAVVGFCMGGRLAFLSGVDARVSKIASFYGTRAHPPVASLVHARTDSPPAVLALFGGTDPSITEVDRAQTKQLLTDAHIPYEEHVYLDAGHAFMNFERTDRYHESSAQDAQNRLDAFLK